MRLLNYDGIPSRRFAMPLVYMAIMVAGIVRNAIDCNSVVVALSIYQRLVRGSLISEIDTQRLYCRLTYIWLTFLDECLSVHVFPRRMAPIIVSYVFGFSSAILKMCALRLIGLGTTYHLLNGYRTDAATVRDYIIKSIWLSVKLPGLTQITQQCNCD